MSAVGGSVCVLAIAFQCRLPSPWNAPDGQQCIDMVSRIATVVTMEPCLNMIVVASMERRRAHGHSTRGLHLRHLTVASLVAPHETEAESNGCIRLLSASAVSPIANAHLC